MLKQYSTQSYGGTTTTRAPFFSIQAFVHPKFNLERSYLHLGPSINVLGFYNDEISFNNSYKEYNQHTDVALGLEAGFAGPISGALHFQADVGLRYVVFQSSTAYNNATGLLYIPVMVGFNYTFQKRRESEKIETTINAK